MADQHAGTRTLEAAAKSRDLGQVALNSLSREAHSFRNKVQVHALPKRHRENGLP